MPDILGVWLKSDQGVQRAQILELAKAKRNPIILGIQGVEESVEESGCVEYLLTSVNGSVGFSQ
jgi:hypothetical protein